MSGTEQSTQEPAKDIVRLQQDIRETELAILQAVGKLTDAWPINVTAVKLDFLRWPSSSGRGAYLCKLETEIVGLPHGRPASMP